jgi:hypothetical protein
VLLQFKDFCQNYSENQSDWPLVRPSKVIPLFWRELLFARIGNILAANDRSRAKSSSRLGLSMRPYQPGDRMATISLSHLMRTGETMTRIDESPGQFSARIFVICTPSLDFRSQGSTCTKGQLAMGVAGLIEAVHLRQNQTVRVIYCSREHLEAQVGYHLGPRMAGSSVSVISDFLDNALESDLQTLKQGAVIGASFYCVRDEVETPASTNPLATRALKLVSASTTEAIPGAPATTDSPSAFSGPQYLENLMKESDHYFKITRQAQCTLRNADESTELSTIIRSVTEAYALARHMRIR